ncbi:MAG TPA: cell wall hydrolase [Caulobacteraceae bacterium]
MNSKFLASTRERALWMGVHCAFAVGVLAVGGFAVREAVSKDIGHDRAHVWSQAARSGYSNATIAAMMGEAGPSALRLAARYEGSGTFGEGRTGFRAYDLSVPPAPLFQVHTVEDAERLNAIIPVSRSANPAAHPFTITATNERDRAVECMTAAVYYESANEPREGKEAVAQVILNRVRHPAYPKSVCGVVFQGSQRYTGCQFTFTCDGSMARFPVQDRWRESRDVAQRALNGYVMTGVGSALNYHATYVLPYWAPTLVKVARYGLHVFYRPPGRTELTGRYLGGEARFTRVNMIGKVQPRPQLATTMQAGALRQFGGLHGIETLPGFAPLQIVKAETTPDGRIRAVINGAPVDGYSPVSPMHNMIAMRKAALLEARRQQAAMRSGAPSFRRMEDATAAVKPTAEAAPAPAPPAPPAAPAASAAG